MAGRWLALGALLLCAAECFAPATRHAAARRPRQPRSTLSPPEADEARADLQWEEPDSDEQEGEEGEEDV